MRLAHLGENSPRCLLFKANYFQFKIMDAEYFTGEYITKKRGFCGRI